MTHNLKQPCSGCPFKRKSLPGWTGSATPDEFIIATLSEVEMPCHMTVDYEDEDWLEESQEAEYCIGSRIFFENICKMPRNPDLLKAPKVQRSDDVFSSRQEFLDHHNSLVKRGKQNIDGEIIASIFQ